MKATFRSYQDQTKRRIDDLEELETTMRRNGITDVLNKMSKDSKSAARRAGRANVPLLAVFAVACVTPFVLWFFHKYIMDQEERFDRMVRKAKDRQRDGAMV